MIGITYIDNVDLFLQFGIFIAHEGYSDLVCYAPVKEPLKNDWPEENGIEVDSSNPKLDSKDFEIRFCSIDFAKIEEFIQFLSDESYHDFNFEELKLQKRLRLISQNSNRFLNRIGTFSLRFADDFSIDDFVNDTVSKGDYCGFELDGTDLSDSFGIMVLEGFDEDFRKSPDVKEKLAINVKSINGLIYDNAPVNYKSKDVNVKCFYNHLIDDNGRYWWQDYYNFLYALIQPGEHELYYETLGLQKFYYKSANVNRLEIINNKIWLEFTLSLVFTNYTPELDSILTIESGEMIEIEDSLSVFDINE